MFKELSEWIRHLLENNTDLTSEGTEWALLGLMVLSVIIFSLIVYKVIRKILVTSVHQFAAKTTTEWDDILVRRKFFRYIALLLPGLVIELSIPTVFSDFEAAIPYADSFVEIYVVFILVAILFSFLNAIGDVLANYESFKDKPIRSYTQVLKILLAIIALIFVISILAGKSPIYILTGLGAVTAILLLLFRDPILGLVASVQMSTIDMVRVGDWISMEKYGADGDVIEINLTSIKVQNWDKTITIIPSYAFISDSFVNWRGMQNSGGRRIKRHLNIKISSIKFVDEKLMKKLEKLDALRDYLKQKTEEIKKFNEEHNFDESVLVNGRRMTNVGVFRIYAQEKLRRNENIHKEMTYMVRHLQPTETGLPLEIYGFSKDQRWPYYEAIMADIFDHLFAAVPYFDLEVFENPSGSDFRAFAAANEADGSESKGL